MDRRLLTRDDFEELHNAFCSAFSSYRVSLNPSREEFDYRLHKKTNVDYQISGGSFDGKELIGFILHSSNLYEGIPTAFNGGTGVIPGFRNQKIGEELYEFLLPKIIQKSLARVILEVIDSNERAIKLYEKVGFSYRRRMRCYKMIDVMQEALPIDISEGKLSDINEDFADFEPSFVDTKSQLLHGSETVLIKKINNRNAGYVVFQPLLGRISQIAVSRLHRGEGIGQALISSASQRSSKPLTIMNIPDDEPGFHRFLRYCGFENQINQFEMELII